MVNSEFPRHFMGKCTDSIVRLRGYEFHYWLLSFIDVLLGPKILKIEISSDLPEGTLRGV